MPEIKQEQPQDRKTIFEILSLPVAKIQSPVARQTPTKSEKAQPGCRKRRSAKGVRSLFSFSGLFRSLFGHFFLCFRHSFRHLFLPNSFCRAPFAAGWSLSLSLSLSRAPANPARNSLSLSLSLSLSMSLSLLISICLSYLHFLSFFLPYFLSFLLYFASLFLSLCQFALFLCFCFMKRTTSKCELESFVLLILSVYWFPVFFCLPIPFFVSLPFSWL